MRKPINHTTKELLKNKMKPKFKGLVLKFDNFLLNQKISDTAKLVYSGIYFSVPEARRIEAAIKQAPIKFLKSKSLLIKELGISRSSYYRAIRELQRINLLQTQDNDHGRTYYELYHYMELEVTEIKAMVTTQMLQQKYVKTSKKEKTFSAKAKIVLGRLGQISRNNYSRDITATATDLRSSLNLKKSTTYYLLKQFISCQTIQQENKDKTIYTLLLMDEYSIYQRDLNIQTNGTHYKKKRIDSKQINKAENNALEQLFSIA